MLYESNDEELRAYCRNCIESLEVWARRIIHEKLREKYGENYVDYKKPDGNRIINNKIRGHIDKLLREDAQRVRRPVDALFLEDLIVLLCHPDFYKGLFKEALDFSYPQGREEVRSFLNRLVPIRNALSHANPISVRQAEQVVCYSHDFIDSIKHYYKEKGLEQMWNVPRIIRITDSLGNAFENPENNNMVSIFSIEQILYCGDSYSVQIEIDSSFSSTDYDIIWNDDGIDIVEANNCTSYTTTFSEKDVSTCHSLRCKIISHKNWHKHTFHDCEISLHLTIFPPLE